MTDTNGPFDGWYYVKQFKPSLVRGMMINVQLLTGKVDRVNQRRGHAHDLDLLVNSIRDHEQLPTKFAADYLAGKDPARDCERMVGTTEDALNGALDDYVKSVENDIRNATSEPKVHAAMQSKWGKVSGSIYVAAHDGADPANNGDWTLWQIPSYANLGDR